MKKLLRKIRLLALPLITGISVALVTLLIVWGVMARSYSVDCLKKEFARLILSLNNAGYDIAYDRAEFTAVSPFKIMEIKNLKLYRAVEDKNERWELDIPEVRFNAGLFDYMRWEVCFSDTLRFKKNGSVRRIGMKPAQAVVNFSKDGFDNFFSELNDISIEGSVRIATAKFAAQRNQNFQKNEDNAFLETYLELADILLPSGKFGNMAPKIQELYINLAFSGEVKPAATFQESFKTWLAEGGSTDVRKLILNWTPLVLVGKGNISFGKELSPQLKLLSNAKALIETMDSLEAAGIFEKKGVFVSKVILGNKAYKLTEDDSYYTVITPIVFSPQQMSIESIPVWKHPQKKISRKTS